MNSQKLWEKKGIHICNICHKTEKCKGADCDFINFFGYHSSCYANSMIKKNRKNNEREYEIISFPFRVLPEYPQKIRIVHNDAVYYFYKLYDRLIMETSTTNILQIKEKRDEL